jgi:hypothetical protein
MVMFSVECHQTTMGESIGIVGSCAELGNWQDIAVMNPQEWPCWSLEVQMHELHSDIEFKYVKVRKDGHVAQWERGHNRKMSLENPPAKDLFVDGGQFGDGQAYNTQPVKKPSNLVPGCVARVRSYPKMAALSAEATQSEAEAVAQEASTAQEAEEKEKTATDLEEAQEDAPDATAAEEEVDADKEEEKHVDAAAADPHHARHLVPGAHSPLEDQEVAPAKEHEEPEPHHPRQLVPGAHSPLEDQDASAPPEKPSQPAKPRRSNSGRQLVPGCNEVPGLGV